jgi:hypothetical protein
MNENAGSIALLVCFAAVVIGPFLLPRLPPADADPSRDKPKPKAKEKLR